MHFCAAEDSTLRGSNVAATLRILRGLGTRIARVLGALRNQSRGPQSCYPLNSLIFEERAVRIGASARCHTTIHRRMRVLWPFHRCSASHAVGMGLGAELGTGFEGLFSASLTTQCCLSSYCPRRATRLSSLLVEVWATQCAL